MLSQETILLPDQIIQLIMAIWVIWVIWVIIVTSLVTQLNNSLSAPPRNPGGHLRMETLLAVSSHRNLPPPRLQDLDHPFPVDKQNFPSFFTTALLLSKSKNYLNFLEFFRGWEACGWVGGWVQFWTGLCHPYFPPTAQTLSSLSSQRKLLFCDHSHCNVKDGMDSRSKIPNMGPK